MLIVYAAAFDGLVTQLTCYLYMASSKSHPLPIIKTMADIIHLVYLLFLLYPHFTGRPSRVPRSTMDHCERNSWAQQKPKRSSSKHSKHALGKQAPREEAPKKSKKCSRKSSTTLIWSVSTSTQAVSCSWSPDIYLRKKMRLYPQVVEKWSSVQTVA